MAKEKPFPKSLGACADLLYTLRSERLAADKAAAALKSREDELKKHIINSLPKDSDGAIGKTHKAVVVRKSKPRVADWEAFYAYVRKHKAFDLLQRRLGEQAVAERWADNKTIPGVEAFQYVDVSLTKK